MIVTRGMGSKKSQGLVVQGYGSFKQRVVEAVVEYGRRLQIRLGQSGTKRREREEESRVAVWAKMVEANGATPAREIRGQLRAVDRPKRSSVVVEYVSALKATWKAIKVTVQRL